MSSAPRGMAIQEAYRHYRDGNLWVNRKYQRKLVWTTEEKERLIDSILKGYPIPLLLLAERPQLHGSGNPQFMPVFSITIINKRARPNPSRSFSPAQ